MKKIVLSIITGLAFTLILANYSAAQTVTNNFQSGNWLYYSNLCWGIGPNNADYYTKVTGGGFNGTDVGETTNLGSAGTYGNLLSPWINMNGNDQITFTHCLSANNGTRTLQVYLVSYPSLSEQLLFTYNYVAPLTTPRTETINHTASGKYRVKWRWTGSGGNSQAQIDNITIGGTNVSDPSNGCAPLPEPVADADNDGVPDVNDAYPNDFYRAYNNYYPAADTATLAFEDLWPYYGDYDMNDVVIGYKFKVVSNAQSQVVDLYASFVLRASGASNQNGFGFTLPNVLPTSILSTTGHDIGSSPLYNLGANGTENGQSKATFIVFEKAKRFIPHGNTIHGNPVDPWKRFHMHIKFMENGVPGPGGAVTLTGLNIQDFNPFIVSGESRGKEIHLAGYAPTNLVNLSLFGTGDDNSNPATGRYYQSASNLVWALDVTEGFDYPIEKASIIDAHLKFAPWAQSNGVQYPDWYQNKPGYRNNTNIY